MQFSFIVCCFNLLQSSLYAICPLTVPHPPHTHTPLHKEGIEDMGEVKKEQRREEGIFIQEGPRSASGYRRQPIGKW